MNDLDVIYGWHLETAKDYLEEVALRWREVLVTGTSGEGGRAYAALRLPEAERDAVVPQDDPRRGTLSVEAADQLTALRGLAHLAAERDRDASRDEPRV